MGLSETSETTELLHADYTVHLYIVQNGHTSSYAYFQAYLESNVLVCDLQISLKRNVLYLSKYIVNMTNCMLKILVGYT